jgi:sugar lactone lactonase YvrE
MTSTLTTLAVSSNALTLGQAEVFTATVTTNPPGGATPSGGTVTFFDGTATIGHTVLMHGMATMSTTTLPLGTNVIRAVYSGAGMFEGSSSGGGSGTPMISTAVIMENIFGPPTDVAEDNNGDFFVSVIFPFQTDVRMIKDGHYTVFAGGGSDSSPNYTGPATGMNMSQGPTGLAIYGGNVYIAADGAIYKVNIATDQATTVIPTGASSPYVDSNGIAVDANGNLFIAGAYSNQIREVNAATGMLSIVAGNGTMGYMGDNGRAASAELSRPMAVAVDNSGDLFIADTGNMVVREVSPGPDGSLADGTIKTVAGGGMNNSAAYGGPATGAQLNDPAGVTVDDSGNLYIADEGANVIRQVNLATGMMTTFAGTGATGYTGDGGPATTATLAGPNNVAMSPDGNILISDSSNSTIREVTRPSGGQAVVVSPSTTGGVPAVVESVAVQKITAGRKSTQAIVIQFNEAMNPTQAQSLATYSLVTLTRSMHQKSKPVALARASYNDMNFTLTLVTRKPLVVSSPLQLTVKAANLTDATGGPFNGGMNAVAAITKNGASVMSAMRVGRLRTR